MGLIQRLVLSLVFASGLKTVLTRAQTPCGDASETSPQCCTCTRQPLTLLCFDMCPPHYFPSERMKQSMEQCDTTAFPTSTQSTPTVTDVFDSVNNSDISTPINKDVSSFYDITCSLCDVACDSCTGNGPGNCSACAEEHTRDHSTGKCVMKKEDRGQSIALIGGVAGGGVTIAALVVMAIVCCCRRQQPHRGGVEDGDQTNVGDDSGPNYADADKTTRPISIIRWLKSKNNKNARYVRDPTAKETGQPNPTVHMEEGEIEEQGFDETDAAGAEMYEITETNQPSGARSYENQAFDHPDDLPSLSQQHTETGDEYIVMGSVEQMQEKSGSEPQAGVDSKSNGAGEEDLYQNTSPKAERTSRSPSDTPPRGNAKSGIYQNTEILSFRSKTVNPRDSGYGTLMTEQETETYLKKQHQLKGQVKKLDTEYENVDFGPRKSTKPMFGQEWQFSQTFSSEGGSLRRDRSDVCLQVPVGAVVTGSQVTIKGAVSTSLDEIENKLNRKLRKDEYIVSPVVEYDAGPEFLSKKPMCIVLPHFLNSLNGSVNVYRVQRKKGRGYVLETLKQVGRDELSEESAQANIASTGVYYFGDKGRIHILTCHFSGYFCTHCGENFTSPELHLEVRAKYSSERKRPVAEVRLDIWDSRFNIQDFRQNRPEQDSFHFKGMRKMDVKTLPALSKDENLSLIELGVRLELEEDDTIWEHKRKYPPQCTIEMKQLVPCNCRPRFPYRVDWHLTTKNDGAGGQVECSVDVGYVRISADARSSQLPFDYLPRPKYVTIAVCVGPESKESGAAQGHEARVAEKAPSVSSRREVAPHSMSSVRPVQTPGYRSTHEPQPSPYSGLGAEGTQLQYPTPSREDQPSPSQSQHFRINTVGHLTIGGDPGSWNPQVQQAQFAMGRLSETDPRRESLTSQEPLYMNLSDHAPVPASGDDNSQREV